MKGVHAFLYMNVLCLLLSCQNTVAVNSPAVNVEMIAITDTIPEVNTSADSLFLAENFMKTDAKKSYAAAKQKIKQLKSKINLASVSEDSLSRLFTRLLLKEIIPYWYGTTWSFEGHTSKPNEGEIACGYFVSTTLKHVGLNLNRYHLAQQLPIHEAMSLQLDSNIIVISTASSAGNIIEIQKRLADGIYFLGFDASHVGYLYKAGETLYIIHSNFMSPGVVVIEEAEISEVFSYFNLLYIAELSTNVKLMKKWIEGATVDIIKG